jgi:hypothetical protein
VAVTESVVQKALATAEQLQAAKAGNEANTKALIIEPMLAALGWDPTDLNQVEREYRVYDGTSLDYALKLGGERRLFVEAKGVTKGLDDKAFVSQTVNYANNEGVLWCVLTNGLSYRVYKTNEPVAMDEKLLFEVDLAETKQGSAGDSAKSLQLISKASLDDGTLELWGERVFTTRVFARPWRYLPPIHRRTSSGRSRRRPGARPCRARNFKRALLESWMVSRLPRRHR